MTCRGRVSDMGLIQDALDAGSTQNAGIALEWQPNIPVTVAAAETAQAAVSGIVSSYQAEAAQFIQEHGASVVGGHSPVGMGASNIAGQADLGGPGNSGASDNTGATTIGTVPPQG